MPAGHSHGDICDKMVLAILGACAAIIASLSFSENGTRAYILLVDYTGAGFPELFNLIANLGWTSGALLGIFVSLYWLCNLAMSKIGP